MSLKIKSFLPFTLNIFITLFLFFGIFYVHQEALAASLGCVCNNESACPSQTFTGTAAYVSAACTTYCAPDACGGIRSTTEYWPCACCDGTDLGERSEAGCRSDCAAHGGTAQAGDPAIGFLSDCPGAVTRPPGCYCDVTYHEAACLAESDCRGICPSSTTVVCVPGYVAPTTRTPGCYCNGTLTREMACTTYTDCQTVCPAGTAATDIMCAPGYSPPPAAGASDDRHPENNPLCWRANQCANNCPVESGCVFEDATKYPPCAGGAGDWGRCVPKSAPITLQIPIMGVYSIDNLSQYIALFYRYLISIGGILAGIMIVIGGLLYLTAGSSDRISSAKSYISHALIGLVLLLTSYLLLQTVNPQLVQISSFTIPLIRPARMPARFCEDYPAPAANQLPLKFALARVAGTSGVKPLSEVREIDFSITDTSAMRCGTPFYEQASGDETCLGRSCESTRAPGAGHPGACVPTTDDQKTWDCMNVAFAGKITNYNDNIKNIVFINKEGSLTGFCPFTTDVEEKIWPDFYYIPRMEANLCQVTGFTLSFGNDIGVLDSVINLIKSAASGTQEYPDWHVASADVCGSGPDLLHSLEGRPTGDQTLDGIFFHAFDVTNNDAAFKGPVMCDVDINRLPAPSHSLFP